MKLKAVIFDMDGVILDSERLFLDCWEEVVNKYELDRNVLENYKKCIGTTAQKTREIMTTGALIDFDYDHYEDIVMGVFMDYARNNTLPVKAGARELLDEIKAKGIKLALASSTKGHVIKWELGDLGLYDIFDIVVSGDMLKRSKPAPDIYLKAIEELGISPEEGVAIEDSYNGVVSAHDAGLKVIMVPDLLEATDEIRDKCECIKDSLTDLLGFFDKE